MISIERLFPRKQNFYSEIKSKNKLYSMRYYSSICIYKNRWKSLLSTYRSENGIWAIKWTWIPTSQIKRIFRFAKRIFWNIFCLCVCLKCAIKFRIFICSLFECTCQQWLNTCSNVFEEARYIIKMLARYNILVRCMQISMNVKFNKQHSIN